MQRLSIGKMARAANVSADTVRYYERVGLISPPQRAKSGYRAYTNADLRRLLLIRRARAVGFSIQEIAELMEVQAGGDRANVQAVMQRSLDAIDIKLGELHRWRTALVALMTHEPSGGSSENVLMSFLGEDQSVLPIHAIDK